MKNILRRIPVLVAMLVLVGIGMVIGTSVAPSQADNLQVELGSTLLNEQERLFAEIYNRVAPSVVSIINATSLRGQLQDTSTGSGFVIDTQGHIVTNYHVVADADRLEVKFFDGTITRAEIIGLDPDSDLAVIQVNIPTERLRPVPLGDSDAVQVGQTVLAMGNPFSNDWTLTSGIVSALNRRIIGLNAFSIGGIIQTDAAINPGNSGGPLLNLNGEVIGVNSQIDSELRQNSGIAFSVPSNLVKRVATDLMTKGSVSYSFIGISDQPISLDLIEAYNLPNNIQGAAVGTANPGYPGANAGLRSMTAQSIDVITAINGRPIRSFNDMLGYLSINTSPGDSITLTVYRDGQILNLNVVLAERPQR